MAIVSLPSELNIPLPLTCAICGVSLTLDKATAGMLDSQGQQTFACVSHFSEVEKLIIGWADFVARERYKSLHYGNEPNDLISKTGEHHARLDS